MTDNEFMTPPIAQPFDYEPDADFNAQLLELMGRWQQGTLTVNDAEAEYQRLYSVALAAGHRANLARVETLLGILHGHRAHLEESAQHFEQARRLYETVGNQRRVLSTLLNLGESYRLMGSAARARQYFLAAYKSAVELDDRTVQAMCLCNQGWMLISLDQLDEAQDHLHRALALCDEAFSDQQAGEWRSEIEQGLATIALADGRGDEAWYHLERALTAASGTDELRVRGMILRLAGDLQTVLGPPPAHLADAFPTDPDRCYKGAAELFAKVHAEGELAHCLSAHGHSLMQRDRPTQASRRFQEAMILFTRLGMKSAARTAYEQIVTLLKKEG